MWSETAIYNVLTGDALYHVIKFCLRNGSTAVFRVSRKWNFVASFLVSKMKSIHKERMAKMIAHGIMLVAKNTSAGYGNIFLHYEKYNENGDYVPDIAYNSYHEKWFLTEVYVEPWANSVCKEQDILIALTEEILYNSHMEVRVSHPHFTDAVFVDGKEEDRKKKRLVGGLVKIFKASIFRSFAVLFNSGKLCNRLWNGKLEDELAKYVFEIEIESIGEHTYIQLYGTDSLNRTWEHM